MGNEIDDPADSAERLEAALERIAHAATRVAEPVPETHAIAIQSDEIATRLDVLIQRLRTALGDTLG